MRGRTVRVSAGLLLALLITGIVSGWTPGGARAASGDGLTGETSYESPVYGYEIEWDGNWTVVRDSTESEAGGVDALRIDNEYGLLLIVGMECDCDLQVPLDFFIESTDEKHGPAEVVDTVVRDDAAAARLAFEAEGQTAMAYIEVRYVGPGEVVVFELLGFDASFDHLMELIDETITYEGGAVFTTVGAEDADVNSDRKLDFDV